jgi:cell division protein FtsB
MTSAERNKWKGTGRKIILAFLFLVLVIVFVFGRRGLMQWNRLRLQVESMAAQNDSLEREISTLAGRIQKLEAADSLELERVARYWGFVRPGEEIYNIRDENDSLAFRDGIPAAEP